MSNSRRTRGRCPVLRRRSRLAVGIGQAKPKSILDAKVKFEDFPFLLRSAAPRLFGSYNEEQAK